MIIVTNGYRGVQPIFAIKPGASGDITLKGDATTNEFIAWSTNRGGPSQVLALSNWVAKSSTEVTGSRHTKCRQTYAVGSSSPIGVIWATMAGPDTSATREPP